MDPCGLFRALPRKLPLIGLLRHALGALKNELANWIVWQDTYDTLLQQEGKEAAEEWRNSLSSIQVAPAAVEAQLKLIRSGGF